MKRQKEGDSTLIIYCFSFDVQFATIVSFQDMALGNDPQNPVHTIKQAGFLLAIVGIANTISRVILGYLSDKAWMNRLYLYNGALAVCGLCKYTQSSELMNDDDDMWRCW